MGSFNTRNYKLFEDEWVWCLTAGCCCLRFLIYIVSVIDLLGLCKPLFQYFKIPGCSKPKIVREIKLQKCFSQKQSLNKVIEKSNDFLLLLSFSNVKNHIC